MKVVQLKAKRRAHRQAKVRQQFESNFIALGSVTANTWRPKERCIKAAEAMAAVLAGLKLHGVKATAVDNAFQFMTASFDYALQSLEGKGFDAVTLKALGLEENETEAPTAH